ncbi:hydrogenase maturation protease [soil metagenome]
MIHRARTLIAGCGNVLRGDDGFGVEVVRRLEESGGVPGAELLDVGTGGIRLAQHLLGGYDRLIVVDAMVRGGLPGDLYVLSIDDVEIPAAVDLHQAIPSSALALARQLHALPAELFLIGCEPLEVDELTLELSPAVAPQVEPAMDHARRLAALGCAAPGSSSVPPAAGRSREDAR